MELVARFSNVSRPASKLDLDQSQNSAFRNDPAYEVVEALKPLIFDSHYPSI